MPNERVTVGVVSQQMILLTLGVEQEGFMQTGVVLGSEKNCKRNAITY